MRAGAILALGCAIGSGARAQQGAGAPRGWPAPVREVHFVASADGTRQPALFFAPPRGGRVPLLVGLHSWSGDYRQPASAPYARWCIDKGWAFIHPDFRGPNRTRVATGSDLAVADIVDAVAFARGRADVDPDRIYLIGTSGGGHACLLMAGRHPELFAGISAWVPIADLTAWHRECRASNQRYWKDLERSCGGPPGSGPEVDREYRYRSPLTHLSKIRSVGSIHLDINAGIHDGHTGSVPIRHSLLAFNALVPAAARFTPAQIESMTTRRRPPPDLPAPDRDPLYGDKQPLVRRAHEGVRVTIFDGGHEGIPAAGLAWLEQQVREVPAWRLHVIDAATDQRQGADGVRLADANGDGRPDVVTGWEEGRAIRVYLHPGPERVREPWPAVTVGTVPSAEDAVFADLDGDGALDVVSSTEGRDKTVYVHWAPRDERRYLDPTAWTTAAIPCTAGRQAFMFALPLDVDGRHGIDLLVGSKGKGGAVGWLQSPADPRDLSAWRYHRIVAAGWIMSLRATGPREVLVSDRKGRRRGVYRLTGEPGDGDPPVTWRREDLGGSDHEVMFLDCLGDGRPIVATRNGVILDLHPDGVRRIPNPLATPWGKAVRIGDIDGDGREDIVHTANTRANPELPGVTWLRALDGGFDAYPISRTGGKFDRIELVDLDGDGDLDVMTCEENAGHDSRGLGVVWFENPTRSR